LLKCAGQSEEEVSSAEEQLTSNKIDAFTIGLEAAWSASNYLLSESIMAKKTYFLFDR
jgi:hypothetical protein